MHAPVAEIIGPDILIILLIGALIFGSSRIPKLARSLGQASHEFRHGVSEGYVEPTPHAPAASNGQPTGPAASAG
jgi:sec-independent protein translocase protein TatA